jgi:hypothetical protein
MPSGVTDEGDRDFHAALAMTINWWGENRNPPDYYDCAE